MMDLSSTSRRTARAGRHLAARAVAVVLVVASLGWFGEAPSPIAAQGGIAGAQDNAVTRWVEETLESVRVADVGTFDAGRVYAMTTVAIYDAVNGITVRDRIEPGREHAVVPPKGAPARADRSVAAAAAAHRVLVNLFPAQRSRLDQALAQEIALSDASHKALRDGQAWGARVGDAVLVLRADDGVQQPDVIPSSGAVGEFHQQWDARFRNMAPFGIADATAYIDLEGPPALTSQEYAEAVVQVATLGQPDGNAANDALARFWRYTANSVKETGGWFLVGLAVARQEGTTESLTDTARLFAWLGMATADAVAVTASEKATHFTWRPQTAIRRANEDGNPLTDPVFDPAWVSRFGNVGESPEWTSGQSTFAGAGAAVLSGFYATDEIAFTFNTLNGAADRSYDRFSDASEEAAFSRILQGIHFQFSNQAGLDAGRGIGTEVVNERLQPQG